MRHTSSAAAPLALSAALCLAAGPAAAQDLEVTVDELVGAGCQEGWAPLRVTVSSTFPEALSGRVVLQRLPRGEVEQSADVTVPARGSAHVVLYGAPGWCHLDVCFEGSRQRQCHDTTFRNDMVRQDAAEVLLVQHELDLRPSLSYAEVVDPRGDAPHIQGHAGAVDLRPPRVAEANLAGTPAAPVLPDRAVGYSQVRMVLAEVALLDRLGQGERRALSRWVRTGGDLAVFATSAAELASSTFLSRDLHVSLRREPGPATVVLSRDLGAAVQVSRFGGSTGPWDYDGAGLEATPYGSRRAVGLGLAHLVLVGLPAGVSDGHVEYEAGPAVDELLGWPARFRAAGWSEVQLQPAPSGSPLIPDHGMIHSGSVSDAEAARDFGLDPNRTDRPPIWLYLFVVALATTAMVLVLRQWARRRNAPVWRLVGSMALVAVAGCLVLFATGAAVRGGGTRYRSMSWVETAAGSELGVLCRHTAVLFDRPGEGELHLEPGIVALSEGGHLSDHGDRSTLLFHGRRWQTLPAVEHGVVDLGGTIDVERDGQGRIVAVHNGTAHELTEGVLALPDGPRALGTVAPGGRALVPGGPSAATSLPAFAPRLLPHGALIAPRYGGAVVGRLEMGCPRRGDFHGDRCITTVVARVEP